MHINTMIKKVKELAKGESYSLERRYSTFQKPWFICVFLNNEKCIQTEGRSFAHTYNKIVRLLDEQN